MDDRMFAQVPQIVEMGSIDPFLEEMVREAIHLPDEPGLVNWEEISVKRVFSASEIEKYQRAIGGQSTIPKTVFDIKEKEIKLAAIYLCGLVHAAYTREARGLGLALAPENFRQIIEIPFSYLDLLPGETHIAFRVFTKRKLIAVEREAVR